MPTALVIDDDRSMFHVIKQSLLKCDPPIETISVSTAGEGLETIRKARPSVVLLDLMLPEAASGLELFAQIKEIDAKLPVIFITASGSSDTAIEAMKLGAFDYLQKPLDVLKVRELVGQALEVWSFMHEPVSLPVNTTNDEEATLVGDSAAMLEVYKRIGRVASQDVTVLIRGASGTGKELIARAIYHHSHRARKPFLALNCAAIPEPLLESELFGHEKGAFTGANSRRIGKFEQCSGGTIFLDEIGDMPLALQAKVLRLLQDQQFERVGGNETVRTDVRLIAATHRDLEEMVAQKEFRADLFFRINVATIDLPPLRERGDDLLKLARVFIAQLGAEMGKQIQEIPPQTLDILRHYSWPGNVRELQSVIRQALLQMSGRVLLPRFLPEAVRGATAIGEHADLTAEGGNSLGTTLDKFIDERLRAETHGLYEEVLEIMERQLLKRVLAHTHGNQVQAARTLGISRNNLRGKIRALGIVIEQAVNIGDEPADEPAPE